jgi:hypothetical protein
MNTLRHDPKWATETKSRNDKNNVEGNNGENERNPNVERLPKKG